VVTEHSQIGLLLKLQRLLSEGSFTASYKFALLQALIDLAVERGEDSDAAFSILISDIADKFISYYWRQVLPYVATQRPVEVAAGPIVVADSGPTYGSVLRQITQANAIILDAVQRAHARFGGSLAAARRDGRSWHSLIGKVARTVREMPLWKLQTIGEQHDDFLYPNRPGESVDHIELRPGVTFTLRRFHGLIRELVRGEWLRFVRGLRVNRPILGESEDLYEFLFGSERASLEPHAEILREVQQGACFYCSRGLGPDMGQVDHFVPWSRYPLDLAHNFVLAHAGCNDSKSNLLASVEHLERWWVRNADSERLLADAFGERRLVHDLSASRAITRWAYEVAEQSGSKVWRSRTARSVELDPRWRAVVGFEGTT
jgi:hypothetical protein